MSSSSATAELQHLLTVPPANFQGNSHNPHAIAHAALEALRDSGDERYLFLRTILELISVPPQQQHQQEELFFHCVTGCRHVILHKWNISGSVFKQIVRDFLMALGQNTATGTGTGADGSLPRTVRLACFSTAAAFWKRQWNAENDDGSVDNNSTEQEKALVEGMLAQNPNMPRLQNSQHDLFQYIETLLKTPDTITNTATFLSVLCGEFMGKSAVQYNLPLEFHKRAHADFENTYLDTCLKLSMGTLSQVVSMITPGVQLPTQQEEVTLAVVQVTIDVISWEFGTEAWDGGGGIKSSNNKTLLRPPVSWRDVLVQPDFIRAIFGVHDTVCHGNPKLGHALRQLLLLLASLSGPMFAEDSSRLAFATYLVDGTLNLLATSSTPEKQQQESSELLDVLSLISRLIANFKLSILVQLPSLVQLLTGIASTGASLLQANLQECESVRGDVESMEHGEWRDECLTILLDGAVLLCDDPWLLYSGTPESRQAAQAALSNSLAPFYTSYLNCRIKMARLEEYYLTANAEELDEVREEISAAGLEEEMSSAASIGRLNLSASLAGLSSLLQPACQQLQALWNDVGVAGGTASSSEISPDAAALLEEARLLVLCVGHLITDANEGETPAVPETIVTVCQTAVETTNAITSIIQSLLALAELQAGKIASEPSNPRLSPFLAKSFLTFLNRWAPAYVLPAGYTDTTRVGILQVWSTHESAQQVISFCSTLCMHYYCYWPMETQVLDGSSDLLLSLAKRGPQMRELLTSSQSFQQLVLLHSITAGMRHNASQSELDATLHAKGNTNGAPPVALVRGYQRLPYGQKSRILTALLVASSDSQNTTATAMLNECLNSVQTAFSLFIQALSSKQVTPNDVNAQDMACLCVELYGGIARASEMAESERIPPFVTPSLPHLSGLMVYYAEDLAICEKLLLFFRDYAEQFVAMLDRDQSIALFSSSAELLKSYSTNHCSARVVVKKTSATEADAEEEQSYSDVLCAIQLLIHLGSKDFIDVFNTNNKSGGGVDSTQVTDMIFFGLQQIIPLMTQGLLQFPSLCTQYFSLVGFMMDTYPEKVCVLPFDLFNALLESLLFGMSHLDPFVSKSSLHGISGITREHLQKKCLDVHLSQHPDIFDNCSRRLLQEVVFHPSLIWDRLEPAGMCLLPLAALDIHRFANVVNGLSQHVCPPEHQGRLHTAFQSLVQPEVLDKVCSGGYEGRKNRIRFKKDFNEFVKNIHSFLVIK